MLAELESVIVRDRRRLEAVAYRYVRNPHDAEDVVQDAIVQAIAHIGQFRGRSKLSTWLHVIVVREALMRLRPKFHHHWVPFPETHEHDGRFAIRGTPESAAIETQLFERVQLAIDSLPPSQREAWRLRLNEELNLAELAERCKLAMGSVKARLSHGRKKLAQRLAAA